MKVLHLTLKKKWFDMVASGEKKEEYREVKPYWINRLTWHEHHKKGELELMAALTHKETFRKDFDVVRFKNGYSKEAPIVTVEILGIHWGYPAKYEWCDDHSGKWFFCIELGKIINP